MDQEQLEKVQEDVKKVLQPIVDDGGNYCIAVGLLDGPGFSGLHGKLSVIVDMLDHLGKRVVDRLREWETKNV